MYTFKEYKVLCEAQNSLLCEGKYADLVKHFITLSSQLKKQFTDEETGKTIVDNTAFEDVLQQIRRRIRQLPRQYQTKMARFCERFMGTVIDGTNDNENFTGKTHDEPYDHGKIHTELTKVRNYDRGEYVGVEIASRIQGGVKFKYLFKAYIMEFFLESLLLTSIVNETAFDKYMDKIAEVYDEIDSVKDGSMAKFGLILKNVPKIISIIGEMIKVMVGDHIPSSQITNKQKQSNLSMAN